jgi:carbon monoxide dehydrogenase subunit G
MQVTLKNRVTVEQSVDRVWDFLSDPRQVATCMPGAEILEALDERTFRGAIKLKLGPFSAQFRGDVAIEHLDPVTHEIRMVGKGKDVKGTGSATMTITGKLTELPGGRTEMDSQSDLVISGKMAQFGSRMIEDVSKSMFAKFTEAMAARLAAQASGAAPEATPTAGALNVTEVAGAVVRGALGRLMGGGGRGGDKDDPGT